MKFSVVPSSVTHAVSFGCVVVDLENETSADPVTLSLGTNPSSGVLSGTLTVNAVAGVAVFSGLQISLAGNGYTFVATAPQQRPPMFYTYSAEGFQNGYFYNYPPSGIGDFPYTYGGNGLASKGPQPNNEAVAETESVTSLPFDVL